MIIENSSIANKLNTEQIEFISRRCQGWPLAIESTMRMLESSSNINKDINELPDEPLRIVRKLYEKITVSDAKVILYYLALIPDFIEIGELEKISRGSFSKAIICDMLHQESVSELLDFKKY